MEDYTYDLAPGDAAVLGAHMLEVCPSIAASGRPARSTRSRSAARDDPVRLVFTARARAGRRRRRSSTSATASGSSLTRSSSSSPRHELPRLPVARALWRPQPDLATAAEAWLAAGGPHHTVLSTRARHGDLRRLRRDRRASSSSSSTARRGCATSRRSCAGTRRTTTWPGASRCARGAPRARRSRRTCEIVRAGLVVLTFGNASAVDREAGVMAIKPSGVGYEELSRESIVVVDLATGAVVDPAPPALVRHADAPRPLPGVRATSEASSTRTRRSRRHGHRPAASSRASARPTPTTSRARCRSPAR